MNTKIPTVAERNEWCETIHEDCETLLRQAANIVADICCIAVHNTNLNRVMYTCEMVTDVLSNDDFRACWDELCEAFGQLNVSFSEHSDCVTFYVRLNHAEISL
jgi:hypothetical protein